MEYKLLAAPRPIVFSAVGVDQYLVFCVVICKQMCVF
jgi:hypothetical protein